MVKLVSLAKGKEKNIRTIEATFSYQGELIPLKVNESDRKEVFNKAEEMISQPNVDILALAKELFTLMSPEASVRESINSSYYLSGNMRIENGSIFFGEQRLEKALSDHMMSLLSESKTPKDEKMWRSYVKFLDNLHQNANEDIRQQLFRWMEYENQAGNSFGITDDGCMVGYKGCEGTILEPMSVFSGRAIVDGVEIEGKIPNKAGSVIQMPRSAVQFDPSVGCSHGLHVGTRDYATKWAPVLLLVKVNPRDVVSVPYECESQKMRVCEYTVIEVTDASSEHNMYHSTDSDDQDEFSEENGALTEDEAYELLGELIEIQYSGGTAKGLLLDVYEDGQVFVVVGQEGDRYVDIELDTITEYSLADETPTEQKTEPVETKLDEADFALSVEEAVDLLTDNEHVYVLRDDGSEYEGQVVDVYVAIGKDPGVIIKTYDDGHKHIKLHRIEQWEVNDLAKNGESCGCDESCNKFNLQENTKVVVIHKVNGAVQATVGIVSKVDCSKMEVIIQKNSVLSTSIEFETIVNVKLM